MDKFFNSDNVVMRTLSKIFDIGWLTLIYLVFCIPIVTVGAATTSLYYVSAKVLRHNRSYVWREFWLRRSASQASAAGSPCHPLPHVLLLRPYRTLYLWRSPRSRGRLSLSPAAADRRNIPCPLYEISHRLLLSYLSTSRMPMASSNKLKQQLPAQNAPATAILSYLF